jgi:hypothetical protein
MTAERGPVSGKQAHNNKTMIVETPEEEKRMADDASSCNAAGEIHPLLVADEKKCDDTVTETDTASSVSDGDVFTDKSSLGSEKSPFRCSAVDDVLLVGEEIPVITTKPQKENQRQQQEKREYPLSTEVAVDGMLTVHSVLPDGIAIGHGPFGRCLIATKDFGVGSLMYRGCALLVQAATDPTGIGGCSGGDLGEHMLHVYDATGGTCVESFTMTTVHSVEDYAAPGKKGQRRQVYGFDSFMNHSCDPNCYCPLDSRGPDRMWYDAVALRDIPAGDEVTCDYACFDYRCDGHEIPVCGCGAASCRGSMMGFRGLSLEEKVRIMHLCEREVLDAFFEENPGVVLFRSDVPDGVAVTRDDKDTYLTATRRYEPGEVVFTNQATLVSKDDLNGGKIFLLKVGNHYSLLDQEHHFIHRKDFCENIGFDCFMDHSCDPNTTQRYEDATVYKVFATRNIEPGDKITCDYNALDNEASSEEAIATTTFACKCGAGDKCRGLVIA